MSVTSYGHALIGVEIDIEKFIETKTRPACNHDRPPEAKYCQVCGRGTEEERTWKPEPERDPSEPGFPGFDVEHTTDQKRYFVGKSVSTGAIGEGGKEADMMSLQLDGKDIAGLREELEKLLTPYGAWNERKFGLWAVGYCSY